MTLRWVLMLLVSAGSLSADEPVTRLGTRGHRNGGVIRAVGLSGDRTRVALAGDWSLCVLDTRTGRPVSRFPLQPVAAREVSSVRLGPDGRYAYVRSEGANAGLWEVGTGRKLAIKELAPGMLLPRGFGAESGRRLPRTKGEYVPSPDGTQVALITPDGEVLLVKATTGPTRRVIQPCEGFAPRQLTFSADSRFLAVVGREQHQTQWDSREVALIADTWGVGGTRRVPLESTGSSFESPVFSPDLSRYAVFHQDGTIVIADTDGNAPRRRWRVDRPGRYDHPDRFAMFSPDGGTLWTAIEESAFRTWDVHTGKEIGGGGHRVGAVGMAFSADGAELTSLGGDGSVVRWDWARGRPLGCVEIPSGEPFGLTPEGQVFYGPVPGVLSSFDPRSRRSRVVVRTERRGLFGVEPFHAVAMSRTRVALLRAGRVDVHDVVSGDFLRGIPVRLPPILNESSYRDITVLLAPDGNRLVTEDDMAATEWSTKTGRVLGRHPESTAESVSPDSKLLLSSTQHWDPWAGPTVGSFVLTELGTTRRRWQVKDRGMIGTTVFSQDGALLAMTFIDDRETLAVREVLSGELVWESPDTWPKVTSLAFSPDGRHLAVARADTTIEIWDLFRRSGP